MKKLMRAIIEQQIAEMEQHLNVGMDILNELVEALESLIEVTKTREELLEEELDELIEEYCIAVDFYEVDNITIAVSMVEDSFLPKVGIAKCNPTDEYNGTEGAIVALRRALELPVDPKQYGEPTDKDCYNCKFEDVNVLKYPCNKCIEVEAEDSPYWKHEGAK